MTSFFAPMQFGPIRRRNASTLPISSATSKWPQQALVFDTETRITADQSLTFGVYRLCEVTQEGILYADYLPATVFSSRV
jgi:hypothetical protein